MTLRHARTRLVALLGVAALVLAACAPDDPAAEPDEHSYEDGDVITLILPTNPGGGFDAQAQLYTPVFEEKLQEVTGADVSIQIEYVPGGNHLVGHQELDRSDPDGRTLAYVDMNNPVVQRVIDGEDLDLREWTPIGGVVEDAFTFYARASLEDDLPSMDLPGLAEYSQQQSVLVGSPSAVVTNTTLIWQGIMAEHGLEVDLDIVTYEGTGEVTTAILREEIDLGNAIPAGIMEFIEEEEGAIWFVQAGCEPSPAIPDVPTLHDLESPGADEACQILATRRAIFGPSGLPEEDAAVLQEALELTLSDEDFVAEFESATGAPPVHRSPDELGDVATTLIEQWESYSHLFD